MRTSSVLRSLVFLFTGPLLLACLAPGASAKVASDLSVPAGKVHATSTGVAGWATVRHRGKTGATAVVLRAQRAGRGVLLQKVAVPARRRSGKKVIRFRAATSKLSAGSYGLRVCVDPGKKVRERREGNNCRRVGKLVVPAGDPGTGSGRDQPVPPPCDTPNCAPVSIPAREQPFQIDDALGHYWAFVPTDYNADTPTRLLVWLHGCGGQSEGDLWVVGDYYDDMNYIAIAPDGAERKCWSMSSGPRRVRTAVADAIARFQIDPRRVVIGGYSSGGDLSYRTAFYNANSFAGLLAINTAPFRDTESSAGDSIAAAAWKFPIVHVAHTGDTTYPIGTVTGEIQKLKDAGFPVTFIQRPGTHYDPNPGEEHYVPGQPSTDEEVQSQLVPHMKDDWSSPAATTQRGISASVAGHRAIKPTKVGNWTVGEGETAKLKVKLKCQRGYGRCVFRVGVIQSTARRGTDFTARTKPVRSKLKIRRPGRSMVATITFTALDDSICEASETARVRVIKRTSKKVAGKRSRRDFGKVKIVDDDCGPQPEPDPDPDPDPTPEFPPDSGDPTVTTTPLTNGTLAECSTPQWIGTEVTEGRFNIGCEAKATCPVTAQVCSVSSESNHALEIRTEGEQVSLNSRVSVFSSSGSRIWFRDQSSSGEGFARNEDPGVNIQGGQSARVECNGVRLAPTTPNRSKISCSLTVEKLY